MAKRSNYLIESQNAVANPTKTAQTLTAASTVRVCIYDMVFGSSATPADNALTYYAQRFTAPGTNSAYNVAPLDSGDHAANGSYGVTNTVEPTYTAAKILAHVAANQRATPRILLDPDAPLITPATASNGIGIYTVHSSFTGNVDIATYFYEV